jgi:hypothetical protein
VLHQYFAAVANGGELKWFSPLKEVNVTFPSDAPEYGGVATFGLLSDFGENRPEPVVRNVLGAMSAITQAIGDGRVVSANKSVQGTETEYVIRIKNHETRN